MNNEPLWEYQNPNIKRYFREVIHTDLLTPEEELELAEKTRRWDLDARNRMIRANLRLVGEIAKDYIGRWVQLADLIQEGNMGLMEAVDRFDPSLGKLSSYATWWINNFMHKAVAEQGRDIRLPVNMLRKIWKVSKVAMSLTEDLWRAPNAREISDVLGIPRRKIAIIMDTSIAPISLQTVMQSQGDGDGESDVDMGREFVLAVIDENNESPFDKLVTDDILWKTDVLLSWLETRDPRKKEIIELRYGLNGQRPHTLDEIGTHVWLTKTRVAQLERQALRLMRWHLRKLENPDLMQARNLRPQGTTKNILDTPIWLRVTPDQKADLLERLTKIGHVYTPITLIRVAILIEKLIQSPNLTPREFESCLAGHELQHFAVQDIPALVMPDKSTYQCLAYILRK